MQLFTLKVIDIRPETADAVTVVFKQPALKKIKYRAGQYLTLMFRINGRRYLRPYSFSSAPSVSPNLEITVKRVPNGIISNHIIDQVKVGDVVEVMEAMGHFIIDEEVISQENHLILWGVGSGITPLMSIAKYTLHHNTCSHVKLVYGNRNNEETIFRKDIENLSEKFGDKFSVCHFHTKPTIAVDGLSIIQGRINPDKALSIILSEGDLKNSFHYICGPSGLKESVKEALSRLNVPSERVFAEDFEAVRDPGLFNDIVTRQVTLIVNKIETKVEVVKGKSILDAALDAMLDVPYSCQTGNCLVCKGRLLNGEVKMIVTGEIPEDLQSNERLLCSSFPTSENVIMSVD
ncbi:oxidoreductase [Mucilaginibacter terrenus]|uniref:Oxidoreductase n=1 Tax=Mucilaginibacter terrenus TaxID=2482727 RepID=A0A3E2NV37_9SPHI|nr:ferredoxin--NADP reductase [Mucilaginibacter terrenus]RFZ84817.1 oxidoreductase [Mucilaginibacter terrenus]